MGCIEEIKYDILLSRCSFKEAREYIKKNFKETVEVPPGYGIFNVYLIGVPPLFVGIDGDKVVFPYTKPCHGTFVMKADGKEEIAKLRAKR